MYKKLILSLLILMIIVPCLYAKDEINWASEYDEALNQAQSLQQPMLVVFIADWCYYCDLLQEETFMDKKVQELINDNFVSLLLDEQSPDMTNFQTNVTGYPTCLILSPDGETLGSIVGYLDADSFLQNLFQYIN